MKISISQICISRFILTPDETNVNEKSRVEYIL